MLSPLVALSQVQKPIAEVTEPVRIRMEVFGSKTEITATPVETLC